MQASNHGLDDWGQDHLLKNAVLSCDLDLAQTAIDAGANVNTRDDHYGTVLQSAVCSGNDALVALLLSYGADVNILTNVAGGTALTAACKGADDTTIIKLLLDYGANPNLCSTSPPLQIVAEGKNTPVVLQLLRILIDAGADVNLKGGQHGDALQAAACHGKEDLVEMLLDAGANPTSQCGALGSALFAATVHGHTHVAKMLEMAIDDWYELSAPNDRWSRRPKYVHDVESTDEEPPPTTIALATLTEKPVPTPPPNELSNSVARETIRKNPHLFKIVTPIKVDRFEAYLTQHPNHAFAQSVCRALREGFWPWAKTDNPDLPVTWDNSYRPLKNSAHAEFVREQRDIEVELGQFSHAFGRKLLPGMYSMPIGVVPKPHSDKLRMVVDQSAEPHSQNSMIPKADASARMDNLGHLGHILRKVHAEHPNRRLVLWKSDVSRAFRLMPMHPLWQIRQVVTIDRQRHVDRCNNFGNRAGGRVWGSFVGLVIWIAIHKKGIEDLLGYGDDHFSWEFEGVELWYEPYKTSFPAKQTRLLQLWDELGIPHEQKKQVFGSPLTIIGFDVDPNSMMITIPADSRSDLVAAIRDFTRTGKSTSRSRSLRDFQKLAGWINWALNAYPLLRPALSTMYAKMSGKLNRHQPIDVDATLAKELLWLTRHVASSDGVHLIESIEWGEKDADFFLYTHVCPTGMGIYAPSSESDVGLQCPISEHSQHPMIDNGMLAVVSAIDYAAKHTPRRRVVIKTNSEDAANMFNTLHANPKYNPLLLTAVDLSLKYEVSFRVVLEPNVVAELLSRFENASAKVYVPKLRVSRFRPPKLMLHK